jgi:D-alanyl-D-alanine carboxypeptidase (penicillin-binding protein 5/6)
VVIKSIICISIILNTLGMATVSDKFDNAIRKQELGTNYSAEASDSRIYLPEIVNTPYVPRFAKTPNILADRYLLADLESGEILLKHNANLEVPIASTTKIMTAVVVLETYNLDDVAIISEKAAYQPGADAFLRVGENIDVKNLLYCMLIKSGNDAAYALAQMLEPDSADSLDKFVELMNATAKRLGMSNTHYEDPAGLNTSGYSSAYDLFTITKHALNNKLFRDIVSSPKYTASNIGGNIVHQLDNSNRLVGEYNYLGAVGVKTGYMPDAGHCLVGAARRDGHTLVAIILRTYADTATASADEARKTLDWGWANTIWR